jgi:hypothetical protein
MRGNQIPPTGLICSLGPKIRPVNHYILSSQKRNKAMAEVEGTQTWPELAIGLYDKLTGRGAQITYEFEDLDLYVPSKVGEEAEHAHWKMNGTLKIRTEENES